MLLWSCTSLPSYSSRCPSAISMLVPAHLGMCMNMHLYLCEIILRALSSASNTRPYNIKPPRTAQRLGDSIFQSTPAPNNKNSRGCRRSTKYLESEGASNAMLDPGRADCDAARSHCYRKDACFVSQHPTRCGDRVFGSRSSAFPQYASCEGYPKIPANKARTGSRFGWRWRWLWGPSGHEEKEWRIVLIAFAVVRNVQIGVLMDGASSIDCSV